MWRRSRSSQATAPPVVRHSPWLDTPRVHWWAAPACAASCACHSSPRPWRRRCCCRWCCCCYCLRRRHPCPCPCPAAAACCCSACSRTSAGPSWRPPCCRRSSRRCWLADKASSLSAPFSSCCGWAVSPQNQRELINEMRIELCQSSSSGFSSEIPRV